MVVKNILVPASALLLVLTACQPGARVPVESTVTALTLPQETDVPAQANPPVDVFLPDEAILILEPGPGSEIAGSLRVRGEADPTFEQNLVVRLVGEDGGELALVPVMIQAETGNRGNFEAEINYRVSEPRQVFVQVYSVSALNGVIEHLSSVGVLLIPVGRTILHPVVTHTERIQINSPLLGAVVSGGLVRVEGIGTPSFEGTFIVEIYDQDGSLVGAKPLIVDAAEMGVSGRFIMEVPYTVSSTGPGLIVVRDPSVVFDGDVHRTSMPVTLAP